MDELFLFNSFRTAKQEDFVYCFLNGWNSFYNNQTFFTSVHTIPVRHYFHFLYNSIKVLALFHGFELRFKFHWIYVLLFFISEFSWLIITFGILTLFKMSQFDAWRPPMDSNASIEFERKSSKNLPLHFDQHIKEEKSFSD